MQTRAYPRTTPGKRMAIKFGCWDSCISLVAAFFVNAAILILAAAAFYRPDGKSTVACTPGVLLYAHAAAATGSKKTGCQIYVGWTCNAGGCLTVNANENNKHVRVSA